MNSSQSPVPPGEPSISMTVIERVARIEETDPLSLAPLYDAIDPDLLDSLADADGFTSLEFAYHGYTVSVEEGDDGLNVSLARSRSTTDESTDPLVDTESST